MKLTKLQAESEERVVREMSKPGDYPFAVTITWSALAMAEDMLRATRSADEGYTRAEQIQIAGLIVSMMGAVYGR